MTRTTVAAPTTLTGDPDAIRASGRRWRTAAMACAAAAAQVGAVAVVDGFLGDEADTWQQRLESDTSTVLGTLATARDIVGGALVSYAEVLEDCQQELRALAVHRAEAGVTLDRWRDTPTAEPDLIDSAAQTVHDLDARSAAILARHAAAVRGCCVQIDRATAMSPGHVAGVRARVTAVRAGGGPGRFRQSSNAVMAGFRLAEPAQLSALGPFLATDNPKDIDSNTSPTPRPWIDRAMQATYRERFFNACRGMQTGATTPGDNTDAFCGVNADAIVESRENILIGLRTYPHALTQEEVYGLDDALADGWDLFTTFMFSGCKTGGNIGACIFDIVSAPIPFAKGAKAVKVGVEVFEDGADVVKAGDKAADAGRAADTGADAGKVSKVTQFGPFSRDDVLAAARAPDRNGLTQAGRGLQKHGGRQGSVYEGRSSGNGAARNAQGMEEVRRILDDTVRVDDLDTVVNIWDSRGWGVRLRKDGTFMGFLEP
ncbi:MAG: hypothetical protein WKF57_01660 [Nakamurella sp.]